VTDHLRGRARRDDSLIPLLTLLVVVAAFGPAAYTAITQWLVPRLSAGGDAVTLSLAEWWDRNWWLAVFWVLELAVLFAVLGWSRRRRRRRDRQMDYVVTGLSRSLPADWEPGRDLRVLRWSGHRPVRLRLQLTPRSALDDPAWRQSLAEAARKVLGPIEPIAWPQPPRSGVFDWGVRPPRIELRVAARPSEEEAPPTANRTDLRLSAPSDRMDPLPVRPMAEEIPIYRRPRPDAPARVPVEQGSAPTRVDRED
jgi:hypothetical protein